MNSDSNHDKKIVQLMSVNNLGIDLNRALAWSEIEDFPTFIDATRNRLAILAYCKLAGLSVSDSEIQQETESIRYDLALESTEQTLRWLRNNRVSKENLAEVANIRALRNKIRQSCSQEELKDFFSNNIDEFIFADVYLLRLSDFQAAIQSADLCRAGKLNFFDEAINQSKDAKTAVKGGYMGRLAKSQLSEDLSIAFFSVDPGDIVGPMEIDGAFNVYLVKNIIHSSFEDVRSTVLDLWYDEKVQKLASDAVVLFGED